MPLPEGIIAGATGHVGHHNTIHDLLNGEVADDNIAADAAIAGTKLDFSVGDANDVDLTSIVVKDRPEWDGSGFAPSSGPAEIRVRASASFAGINEAIGDCVADGGGIVELVGDDYAMTDELILPEVTVPLRLRGRSGAWNGVTRLHWSSDLGAGKFAIRSDPVLEGDAPELEVENLWLHGPQLVEPPAGVGDTPSDMEGLRMRGHYAVRDTRIEGFHSGIYFDGDHCRIERATLTNNYYNFYVTNDQGLQGGDIVFIDVSLTGSTMASIGIKDDASLNTATFIHGHLGFGPYCIYIEGPRSSAQAMYGVRFIGTSFEAFGNAVIFDQEDDAELLGVTFLGQGSDGFGQLPTYNIAANPYTAAIAVHKITNWSMELCVPRVSTNEVEATTAVFIAADEIAGLHWRSSDIRSRFLTAAANSLPLIAARLVHGNRFWDASYEGYIGKASSGGAVTAGQVVAWYNADQHRPYATAYAADPRSVISGIALTDAPAHTSTVQGCLPVISAGRGVTATASATMTSNAPVAVSTSNRNEVAPATSGREPIIGMLASGSATSAGSVTVDVHLGRAVESTGNVTATGGGKETLSTNATSGSAATIDLALGNVHRLTLTAACTLTFTGATSGQGCSFTLVLIQNGTGGWAVTWPASVDWPGGAAPTLSTALNKVALFTFLSTDGGTTWLGSLAGDDLR